MAYRAHIMVYDATSKRVGLSTLKRVFPAGLRYANGGGLIGYTGTRNGAPGFWIEGGTKSGLASAVQSAAVTLRNVGYSSTTYTTNIPSDDALRYSLPDFAIVRSLTGTVRYGGRG